jgi:hypothetical protein
MYESLKYNKPIKKEFLSAMWANLQLIETQFAYSHVYLPIIQHLRKYIGDIIVESFTNQLHFMDSVIWLLAVTTATLAILLMSKLKTILSEDYDCLKYGASLFPYHIYTKDVYL